MPIVPRLTAPQVGTAPLPGVRSNPGPPAPGPDFSGALGAFANIVADERRKADQVAVNDADNKATTLRDQVLYGTPADPTLGILNKRGADAFKSPEEAIQKWKQGLSAIENGLTSDEQKLRFRGRIDGYDHNLHEQIQAHIAAERRHFDDDSTNGFIANRVKDALANYDNDQEVDKNLKLATLALRDHAQRTGKGEEWTLDETAKLTSGGRLDVLKRYLINDQDVAATKYLAKYRADFVGTDLLQAEQIAGAGSTRGTAIRTGDLITSGRSAPGLVTPGTIDLAKRPRVANQDGSTSTVRSISIEEDGQTILIPTVSPQGKILTNDAAIALYHKTGAHLGIFATQAAADAYAQRLHDRQARGLVTGDFGPTFSEALGEVQQKFDAGELDAKGREATEQRVRRYFEDKAANERQEQAGAYQGLATALTKTGDLDLARKQLPGAWELLSPAHQDALERREDDLRHPTVKTNLAVYTHLLNMASVSEASRAAFQQLDLTPYVSKLSEADYKHVVNLQAEQRRQDARAETAAEARLHREQERAVLVNTKKQADKDAAAEEFARLTGKKAPTAKTRLTIPQWMADSAQADPAYRDYLTRMGVPLAAASPAPDSTAGSGVLDTRVVPGGPIRRQP